MVDEQEGNLVPYFQINRTNTDGIKGKGFMCSSSLSLKKKGMKVILKIREAKEKKAIPILYHTG